MKGEHATVAELSLEHDWLSASGGRRDWKPGMASRSGTVAGGVMASNAALGSRNLEAEMLENAVNVNRDYSASEAVP